MMCRATKNGARDKRMHDTTTASLCVAGHSDTSLGLMEGNFQVLPSRFCFFFCFFFLLSTCADMLFLSYGTKLRNCGRLQNALERRVPTVPHPPSLC